MSVEFVGWGKTPRYHADCVITEKIDGTNAAVRVCEDGRVFAQSRKRIITPSDDNFGFAGWVEANAGYLVDLLGVGLHFGEWWGSGIQRGYGAPRGERTFSLFDAKRWSDLYVLSGELSVVPVLYEGPFFETALYDCLEHLGKDGSRAAPGFMKAEGVVVNIGSYRLKAFLPGEKGDG